MLAVVSEILFCCIKILSKSMKIFWVMVAAIFMALLVISFLMPPLPILWGGIIGIVVFLGVGNIVLSLMDTE